MPSLPLHVYDAFAIGPGAGESPRMDRDLAFVLLPPSSVRLFGIAHHGCLDLTNLEVPAEMAPEDARVRVTGWRVTSNIILECLSDAGSAALW